MARSSVFVLGKIGVLLLLPLLLLLIPTAWLEGHRSLCLVRRVLGRPCPGCGMTRALSCVLHGRFRQGYQYNRRVVIVLPLLAYAWVRALATEYRRLAGGKRVPGA